MNYRDCLQDGVGVTGAFNSFQNHCPCPCEPIPFRTIHNHERPAFAYIYNQVAETVNVEADITFSSNGTIEGAISHPPGTSTIVIGCPGIYAVWFDVTATQADQFALFHNGAPVPGGTYGIGLGTTTNTGMAIIYADHCDVLTVRNHTSATAITLGTLVGGLQTNTNASVLILKIA